MKTYRVILAITGDMEVQAKNREAAIEKAEESIRGFEIATWEVVDAEEVQW